MERFVIKYQDFINKEKKPRYVVNKWNGVYHVYLKVDGQISGDSVFSSVSKDAAKYQANMRNQGNTEENVEVVLPSEAHVIAKNEA